MSIGHSTALVVASALLAFGFGKRLFDSPNEYARERFVRESYEFPKLTLQRSARLDQLLKAEDPFRRLLGGAEFLARSSTSDFPAIIEQLHASGDMSLVQLVHEQWASRDPASAIEYARQDLHRRTKLAGLALSKWAESDLSGALQGVGRLGHEGRSEDSDRSRIGKERREDVVASERVALNSSSPIGAIFESLTDRDPQRAAEQALEVGDLRQRGDAIRTVAGVWAKHDPERAVAWAKSIPGAKSRNEALRSALAEWASSDPAAASQEIAELPMTGNAVPVIERLAESWAADAPDEALTWIVEHTSGATQIDALTAAFANTNSPALPAQLFVDSGIVGNHPELFSDLVAKWTETNAEAALDWVDNLDLGTQAVAMGAALEGLAHSGTDEAIEWYRNLDEGLLENPVVLRGLAQGIGATAPEKGLELLAELENWHHADIINARNDLTTQLADSDPVRAAAWMSQFHAQATEPLSRIDSKAVQSVASSWAANDLHATGTWIEELPQGALKDAASKGVSRHLLSTDPSASFAHAANIRDFRDRTNWMSNLFKDLPTNGNIPELLAKSPLSQSDKDHLQRDLKMHGHLPR